MFDLRFVSILANELESGFIQENTLIINKNTLKQNGKMDIALPQVLSTIGLSVKDTNLLYSTLLGPRLVADVLGGGRGKMIVKTEQGQAAEFLNGVITEYLSMVSEYRNDGRLCAPRVILSIIMQNRDYNALKRLKTYTGPNANSQESFVDLWNYVFEYSAKTLRLNSTPSVLSMILDPMTSGFGYHPTMILSETIWANSYSAQGVAAHPLIGRKHLWDHYNLEHVHVDGSYSHQLYRAVYDMVRSWKALSDVVNYVAATQLRRVGYQMAGPSAEFDELIFKIRVSSNYLPRQLPVPLRELRYGQALQYVKERPLPREFRNALCTDSLIPITPEVRQLEVDLHGFIFPDRYFMLPSRPIGVLHGDTPQNDIRIHGYPCGRDLTPNFQTLVNIGNIGSYVENPPEVRFPKPVWYRYNENRVEPNVPDYTEYDELLEITSWVQHSVLAQLARVNSRQIIMEQLDGRVAFQDGYNFAFRAVLLSCVRDNVQRLFPIPGNIIELVDNEYQLIGDDGREYDTVPLTITDASQIDYLNAIQLHWLHNILDSIFMYYDRENATIDNRNTMIIFNSLIPRVFFTRLFPNWTIQMVKTSGEAYGDLYTTEGLHNLPGADIIIINDRYVWDRVLESRNLLWDTYRRYIQQKVGSLIILTIEEPNADLIGRLTAIVERVTLAHRRDPGGKKLFVGIGPCMLTKGATSGISLVLAKSINSGFGAEIEDEALAREIVTSAWDMFGIKYAGAPNYVGKPINFIYREEIQPGDTFNGVVSRDEYSDCTQMALNYGGHARIKKVEGGEHSRYQIVATAEINSLEILKRANTYRSVLDQYLEIPNLNKTPPLYTTHKRVISLELGATYCHHALIRQLREARDEYSGPLHDIGCNFYHGLHLTSGLYVGYDEANQPDLNLADVEFVQRFILWDAPALEYAGEGTAVNINAMTFSDIPELYVVGGLSRHVIEMFELNYNMTRYFFNLPIEDRDAIENLKQSLRVIYPRRPVLEEPEDEGPADDDGELDENEPQANARVDEIGPDDFIRVQFGTYAPIRLMKVDMLQEEIATIEAAEIGAGRRIVMYYHGQNSSMAAHALTYYGVGQRIESIAMLQHLLRVDMLFEAVIVHPD